MPVSDWTPSVEEVAAHIRARTKQAGGGEAGTFNENTRPTAEQAELLIANAARSVAGRMKGIDPCNADLESDAKNAVALRAAMAIEASYYPEQTRTDRSNFAQLRMMYEDDVKALLEAIVLACGGEPEDGSAASQSPVSSFDGEPVIGRSTPWEW